MKGRWTNWLSEGYPVNEVNAGEALKEAGCARVLANTPEEWKSRFNTVALKLLNRYKSVTAEQVVEQIGNPPGHINAIGATMRAFAKEHKLTSTPVKSKHTKAHGRFVMRWCSE
jgi:hypothetical protein